MESDPSNIPRYILIVGFACFLTQCIDDELQESTARKLRLEDKDKNFQKMLHYFPEGVAFFGPNETKLFINPYWRNVANEINFHQKSMSNFAMSSKNVVGSLMVKSEPKLIDHLTKKDYPQTTLRSVIRELSSEWLSDKKQNQNEEFFETDSFNLDNILNPDDSEFLLCDEFGNIIKEYNVKIVCVKYFDGQNSLLAILNDVTDRLKLRDEKLSNKMKTMMLCSVSHELRSPLNQINGMLYLAKNISTNQKIRDYIEMAESSSDYLLMKINDILDYYEIENDSFKPRKESFNLNNFMFSVKETFKKFMDIKTKNLSILLSKNTPDFITHDKDRLKQVLHNIISNAIKYTEKGFIVVTVDWENTNDGSFIKFQVSDSGSGIPKHRSQKIYELFGSKDIQRVDKHSNNESTKLAGLGISIANRILKKFNSELSHKSTLNVGSKFWFTLKVDEFEYSGQQN